MYLKQMEIVTDQDKLTVDIQETVMKYKTIKQWAYILHDRDDTRPHYHVYLNFGSNGVDTALVAGWFKVAENFISKVKGRKTDVLLYLTHGNDTQRYKHQYDASEVVANFDFQTEIENAKIIGDFDGFSYAQQLSYVNALPRSEKAKAYTQLKKLWELYCQCLTLKPDRKVDVIFICGKAGAGKTYYAKKMLDSLNYDYCISSSSNDPFQDYLGQKAIILDDLRHSTFRFDDLLKILDNNTSSSAKSRFQNKVFNGSVIVVTSCIPLRYWYPDYRCNAYDTLTQLYRRISCYVDVQRNEITVYNDGVDHNGMPAGVGVMYRNELADKVVKQAERTDFNAIFGRMCDRSVDNTVFEQTSLELHRGTL